LRVAPDSICATLAQGWPRRSALKQVSRVVEAEPASAASGSASTPDGRHAAVGAAIAEVLRELCEVSPLRGARLEVDLADALVHIDVVAGDFAAYSDRQLQVVASGCASELLSEAAAGYEIRWNLQADAKHLLIAAIDRSLLAVLANAAKRHALKFRSMQPDLCTQWNRHADALKPGSAVFAVASGGNALISCVSDGSITAVGNGGWLDSEPPVDVVNARVKSLMCGLGLQSEATARLLDTRTDRLLASVGLNAAHQSAFVLVGPNGSDKAVSSRWTALGLADMAS
jgi:hypothetical protein